MSKLYDILNSVITRLKKVETTEPDWNASEGEAGHVKNRTHYEQLDVQSHTNFVAELAPHYPDPRDGTCRLGQDIAAFALLTTAKYNSRKGGWDWNRYGVGNRRLYLYIDDTKIEIPLELITNLKSVELEETYNDHRITICGYGPSAVMLYDENNNFLQQTKGCFLMATVFGWGSETPLPNMRLVYGELELKPLDEMFIPNSIPKVQTAAVGQTVVVKAVDENGKPTEWEAADVGGGGVLYVDSVVDMDSMDEEGYCPVSSNRTYAEIYEAYANGRTVICRMSYDYGEGCISEDFSNLVQITHGADRQINNYAVFERIMCEKDCVAKSEVVIRNDGDAQYQYIEIAIQPQ